MDIYAGDPQTGVRRRTAHCVVVFVGLDSDGNPTTVPPWRPASKIDLTLQAYAVRLSELRKQMDSEMEQRLGALAATVEEDGQ